MAEFINEEVKNEQKKEISFLGKVFNSWDNLDKFFKSTIIIMSFIIIVTPIIVSTQFSLFQRASLQTTITMSVSSNKFFLSPTFFGQSVDNADGTQWDSELGDRTVALSPGVLRYPTSLAACWDWRSGKKYPDSLYPCFYPGFINRDTLQQFALIVKRTGAVPIFVLNMFSSGNSWDEKLNDQIEFLKTARDSYKLPIKYVELGNEISYRTPLNISLFPIVDNYAEQSNIWITKLKKEFPGILVGVSGYDVVDGQGNGKLFRASWNQYLLSNVTQSDGIIFHLYSQFDYPIGQQKNAISYMHTDTGRKELFYLPFKIINNLDEFIKELTGIKKIWITEIGIKDPLWGISGMWGSGLARLATNLLLINKSESVDLTIPRQLYGAEDYGLILRNDNLGFWNLPNMLPKTLPYKYTGYGIAYSMLAQAIGQDLLSAQEINFSPLLKEQSLDGNSYPTLLGYLFNRPSENQAIILNLGSSDLVMDLSSDYFKNLNTEESLSGQYSTLVIGDTQAVPNGLIKLKAPINSSRKVLLPAFSVIRLFSDQPDSGIIQQISSESARIFVLPDQPTSLPSDILDYKNSWQEIVNNRVGIIRNSNPSSQIIDQKSSLLAPLQTAIAPTITVLSPTASGIKTFNILDFIFQLNSSISSFVVRFFTGK